MQKAHHTFLKLVRKWRLALFLLFLVASASGGFILKGPILIHQSEATFYITGEKLINPITNHSNGPVHQTLVSFEQTLVEQLTFSTGMMQHLIDTFHLYRHYQVDTLQRYYSERTANRLRKRIDFKKLTPDLASITVKDNDNELAASMANAIVKKLNQMKNEYVYRKLGSSMKIYNAFIEDSRSQIHEQNVKMLQLISGLRDQFPKSKIGAMNQMNITELESAIYETIRINGSTLDNFIRAQANLSEIMIMFDEDAPVSIVPLKRALPDTHSKIGLLLLVSVGIGVAVLSLTLMVSYYFYFSLREELRILSGKSE